MIGLIFLSACGNRNQEQAASTPKEETVLSPLIAALQNDETEEVLRLFREIDWSQRPLFPASSPLSLSEGEYMAAVKRQRPGPNLMGEIQDFLKPLSREVLHAGKTAALEGNVSLSQDYFESLKAFGQAIQDSELTLVVTQMGQAFVASADAELVLTGTE